MISRDAARPLLTPLAAPTLAAFAAAKECSQESRKGSEAGREMCSPPALALMDGISFWSYFAGATEKAYAKVPGVQRIKARHPLTHAWLVRDALCVRMRSDIAGVDVEQLSLFELAGDVPAAPELIALTWAHVGPERFGPTFVHITGGGQVWRFPVESLLDEQPAVMPIKPPVPRLSSNRPQRGEDKEQSRDSESR